MCANPAMLNGIVDDQAALAWCFQCKGMTPIKFLGLRVTEKNDGLQVQIAQKCRNCEREGFAFNVNIEPHNVHLSLRTIDRGVGRNPNV